MTKTQVQQMILLALVLFAVLWFVFRKGEPSAPQPPAPGRVVAPPLAPAAARDSDAPAAEPAAIVQAPIVAEPTLARDIFQVPTELLDRIRQREEEERRAAEARKKPVEPIREVIPVQETDLAAELELQGIFWGVPRPQALINRQILSVGDTIRDAEVLSISKEGVILSFAGQKIELKSPPAIRPNEEQQGSGASQGRGYTTFNP